jgi:hypothetical protein
MECGRIFWEAWVDWHLAYGFQIIHEERCYLCYRDDLGHYIKLGYHVDDNMVVALGEELYAKYLADVRQKFDIEEGELDEHLGLLYSLDLPNGVCRITQPVQIMKVLRQFGMENCNAADTPMITGPLPSEADCEDKPSVWFDMEGFVGHISWLHLCTRPDLGRALKHLSRFTKKYGKKHVEFAKHILRYLKGTQTLGLTYRTGFPLYFQIFTDASHAGCVDTRRSIVSIVVKFGGNTVYWKVNFTTIVCHSSTESELMALDVGATVSQCLRWLLEAMGGPVQYTIQIFVDNESTIQIGTNPVQSGRNLHVHARYYYCRDLVYDDLISIESISTHLQVADVGCAFKGAHTFKQLLPFLMGCARVRMVGAAYEWETHC